jgi:hypothetical protein
VGNFVGKNSQRLLRDRVPQFPTGLFCILARRFAMERRWDGEIELSALRPATWEET